MALEPGQIINDTYRVERLLGAGGMAEVYKVIHTRLPKHFALKLMKLAGGEQQEFLARFRREAEILGSLNHPHIVDVNDWNQLPDGSPYLVMELLQGEDLATFLSRTGQLTPQVTLHICKQIGEALFAAHLAGVVHRDLKPGNVFLSNNGPFPNYVKVLDFGVAKVFDNSTTPITANAVLMGTPAYMAPEQALGKTNEIDARTDQFALASMAYEMLSGQPAFYRDGDEVLVILTRIVQGETPQLPPHLPEHLGRALGRALSKKKEERFPSMKEFLAALGATNDAILSQGAGNKSLAAQSTIEKRIDKPLEQSLEKALERSAEKSAEKAAEKPLSRSGDPPISKRVAMSDDLTQPPRRPQRMLYLALVALVAIGLLLAGLYATLHH